eukprot:gene45656-56888_t
MPETSFLHQNHRTTFLGTQLTNINDINNAGVMAGTMHGTVAATLANGQTTLLLNDDRYSAATAINNHGVAVGWATNRGLFAYRAMMYSNGTATDLGTLGGREAFATDINDAGVIVGRSRVSEASFDTHAFIYQDGVMTDLGAPAAATNSTALTITEDGTVLVSGQLPNGSNKSYLYRDGATTDLSGIFTRAVVDMNNAGTILGQSNEGFLVYDKLGQAHDLSLEVAQTTGGTLAQVFAIGDNGTVGAEICHGISCTVALMIPSPVPEPETGNRRHAAGRTGPGGLAGPAPPLSERARGSKKPAIAGFFMSRRRPHKQTLLSILGFRITGGHQGSMHLLLQSGIQVLAMDLQHG